MAKELTVEQRLDRIEKMFGIGQPEPKKGASKKADDAPEGDAQE